MDKAPGVLIAEQRVQRPAPPPRLRLLLELEPRHRVFFRNLRDLLLSRRVPPLRITARPAPFWKDVFVPSGAPWSSFVESMLWHVLVIVSFLWGQSRVWVPVEPLSRRDAFHRSITYYPLTQSFPAAQGRAPSVRPRPRAPHPPPHQAAMPVTPEHKPSLVTPPDIKQATAKLPNLLGTHTVTPIVPFPASDPRRNTLSEPSGVVAPQPQIDQATARRQALPQTSAVAPAPELAPSVGRALKTPNTAGLRVVQPPPSLQNAGNPARGGKLNSLSGAGPNVVPPPPSVQESGSSAGDARLRSIPGAGSQVVPPPPTVQGTGTPAGAGRMTSFTGAGPNVVPPPPSVQGGNAAGDGRLRSIAGAGSQVVPPPPSVQGSSTPAGGSRTSSLSGAGSEVVPPPPSVEGAVNSGAGGRLGSPANGSQIMPSPPPVETARNTAGAEGPGKLLEPMDPLPVDTPSSASASGNNNDDKSTFEELPLGLLGVVFAAPGTSFFSNFEVFVVKRRMGKDQTQLIKLVYEFLPYQRRLSEYNLDNQPQRVIKLKVTPDPTCDESLGHMIQVQPDPTSPATDYPKLPAALRSADLNAVLPCYRTTAGDFQKAMSRVR
jgi:hypothetical protein